MWNNESLKSFGRNHGDNQSSRTNSFNSLSSDFSEVKIISNTSLTNFGSLKGGELNGAPSKELRLEGASRTPSPSRYLAQADRETEFLRGLEDFLDYDSFEPGVTSAAEKYVERWLVDEPLLVQIGVGKVFLTCNTNERRLIGILSIVAHLEHHLFHPMNELIALSALTHPSVEVKECAVRAYEYWEDPKLAERLVGRELTPRWLDDYRLEVISDICGGRRCHT